jgi:hypothetical protein
MAGYLGTKAVLLSTTAADVVGNAEIGGDLTVGGTVTADGLAVARSGGAAGSGNVAYIDVTSSFGGLSINSSAGNNAFIEFLENGVKTAGFNSDATANVTSLQSANGHALAFNTDGTTERMRIDSSGNVGIGTTAAAGYKLDVNGAFTVGGDYDIGTAANGGGVNIGFNTTDGGNITALNPSVAWYPMEIGGGIVKLSTSGLERMRIASNGRFMVAQTSLVANGQFEVSSTDGNVSSFNANSIYHSLARFQYASTTNVGSITTNGSSTAYNTTSDYRLKTDAQPMTGASARVQALNPVNFEWISTGERVDGFLAHEAQEVVPEAVTGAKDAMRDEQYEVTPAVYEDVVIPAVLDEEGNELQAERTEQRLVSEAVMGTRSVPDYQGIDQSKLVPLLTAALQEALTEIADLKARVTALEAV